MPQTPITIQMGNTKVGQHLSRASFAVQVHGGHTTPVRVQKWGHGAGKIKRGGLRPPRTPKQLLTPFRFFPQQVVHAPVLHQTWIIPFLGRHLGVPMLIWMYKTWGTFCSPGSHPQRIETVTISLTKAHQNDNTQVSSLDPWVSTIYSYRFLPFLSFMYFPCGIFELLLKRLKHPFHCN